MKIFLIAIVQILVISIGYTQIDTLEPIVFEEAKESIPKYKYGDTILINNTSYNCINVTESRLILKVEEKIGVFDLKLNPILAPAKRKSIKVERYGIEVSINLVA